MASNTMKLISNFVRIDNKCKKKMIADRQGRGRPSQLGFSEIATICAWFNRAKMRSFKTFYTGIHGDFLRLFFPKMPSYTAFLKQVQKHARNFYILAVDWKESQKEQKFYIDSTPLPVCEDVRSSSHKVFAGMAQWAHSSTGTKFGLKLHVVVDEKQKIRNFVLTPGAVHDVSCAEKVLKGFKGTVVGDKGYCSAPLAKLLQNKGLRLVARHRRNMKPNTREEKELLRKRPIVETVIGKFKNFFGNTLSRFRSPQAAFSAICAAIVTVNLGC